MLPAVARLRRPDDFSTTVRQGRRGGSRLLVVHLVQRAGPLDERGNDDRGDRQDGAGSPPALVGFIVSRAVGPAVVRNRVKRRLRAQVRERLAGVPSGSKVVVRALPAAGAANSAELGAALDRALEHATRARPARPAVPAPVAGC